MSVLARVSTAAVVSDPWGRPGIARTAMFLPALGATAAAWAGWPSLCLASLVLSTALALAGGRRGWVRDVPMAALLTMTAVTVGSLVGHAVGLHPLGSTAAARWFVTGLALVSAVAGQWRLSARVPEPEPRRRSLVPFVPGLVMGAVAVVLAVLPVERGVGWILGGDNLRHLVFVAQVRDQGGLDYSAASYPRAWHSLVALGWSLSSDAVDGPGVVRLIETTAAFYWVLYGLLALTVGALACEIARRSAMTQRQASVAGLLAGSMILWPQFIGVNLVQGFETSVLGAVVLAVSSYEVTRRPGSARSALAVLCGILLLAHTWQLLLPAELLLLALTLVAARATRQVRIAAPVLLALVVAPLSIPPIRALLHAGGVSIAGTFGWMPDKPVWVPALVLLGCVAWTVHRPRNQASWPSSVVALLLLLETPALAVAAGQSVFSYYPQKVLQVAVLCAVPVWAVATTSLLAHLIRRWPRLRSSPASKGLFAALVGVCLLTPLAAPFEIWSSVDTDAVLGAVASPGAAQAQVVWLVGHESEATTARMIMDVYRPTDGGSSTPQLWLPVPEECELLRAAQHPAVLSDAPAPEVQRRFACSPGVTVIPVRR